MNIAAWTDKSITGFVLGLIFPLIAFLVFYTVTAQGTSLFTYLAEMISSGRVTKVVTFCVIPDVILFFVFNRYDMLRGARGVLGATFFWVLVIVADRIF